jgi:hypothetical protein
MEMREMALVIFLLVPLVALIAGSAIGSRMQMRRLKDASEAAKLPFTFRGQMTTIGIWVSWGFAGIAAYQGRWLVCVGLIILPYTLIIWLLVRAHRRDEQKRQQTTEE